MNHTARQGNSGRPIASRSPSPDTVTSNMIVRTKPLDVKIDKKFQKVPVMQQIIDLKKENKMLKSLLEKGGNKLKEQYEKELEQKDRQIEQLKSRIPNQRVNRRLFVTLTDSPHRSLQNSTQKKRPSITQDQYRQQINNLRKKIFELQKDNEQLRKSLVSRSIRLTSENKNPFSQKRKSQHFVKQIQNQAKQKISQLQQRIVDLQKQIRKYQQNQSRSSHKISLVTTSKKGGVNGDIKRFSSPQRQQSNQSHLQAQLTVSKNNIIQLQRQNQNLTQQNNRIKKAYEQLLKKSQYSNASSNQPTQHTFQIQSQLNRMIIQNKSLKDTLQGVRNNLDLLHEQNHHLRIQLCTFEQNKQPAAPQPSPIEIIQNQRLKERISELSRNNILISKQKDVLKDRLFTTNSNNQKFNSQIKSLDDQNIRLHQQNKILRGNIAELLEQIASASAKPIDKGNSRLQEIWNQLTLSKKRIEELELKNKQLEKQLSMKGKEIQITKLKDQLNKALSQQKKVSSSEADNLRRQLTVLQQKLQEADNLLQKSTHVETTNKKQIINMLRSLQELKRMLDRISFQFLESNLKQIGFKYKAIIEDRIQILRSLKQKTSQNTKYSIENQRLKQQIVEATTKHINEKAKRQQLQTNFEQQQQEARILKQQIRQLNTVLNQYITKQIQTKSIQQSRIRQLQTQVVDENTEQSLENLKQLENQVREVSNRLDVMIKKVAQIQRE